jgi:hypothetical protein
MRKKKRIERKKKYNSVAFVGGRKKPARRKTD